MAFIKGIVRHADQTEGYSSGSTWISKVKYRQSEVSVAPPASGRRRDTVTCPICGKMLNVQITSGRRNTLVFSLGTALVLMMVIGLGWGLFSSIASDGLTDTMSWLPMLLLWGVAPFIAAFLANTLLFGVGPSGRIAEDKSDFREGGLHEFYVESLVASSPTGRYAGRSIFAVAQLLGLFLGYQFSLYQWGKAPNGDRLVQLIGMDHNSDEALGVLRPLGQLDQTKEDGLIYWKRHDFTIMWDDSGKIRRIRFGDEYRTDTTGGYKGPLPFELKHSDKQSELATKLGPSTISDKYQWLGTSKTGYRVEIRLAPYGDTSTIKQVTVQEKDRAAPPEQTPVEQTTQEIMSDYPAP